MKYNGIELKEFTSDKPVLFDPPREMLVWDRTDSEPFERSVVGYFPIRTIARKVITMTDSFMRCAEIPKTPKSRRATNRELAMWLAKGNGEILDKSLGMVFTRYSYSELQADDACVSHSDFVRKWDDKEWHEPTIDYIRLPE